MNSQWIENKNAMPLREMLEEFAIVCNLDTSKSNCELLLSILDWHRLVDLNPQVSEEAARLYQDGYTDAVNGKSMKYTFDSKYECEEHF